MSLKYDFNLPCPLNKSHYKLSAIGELKTYKRLMSNNNNNNNDNNNNDNNNNNNNNNNNSNDK